MRIVNRTQTFDGILHETSDDAKRHIDVIYGKELTKIAGEMSSLVKYSKIAEYIDSNLERFINLSKIKSDSEIDYDE